MSWYKNHPGKQAAALRLLRYKLTHPEYEKMWKRQKGFCKICRTAPIQCVDHSRKTGKVRALLCSNCNTGIGLLRESPKIFRAAIRYLKKYK